MVYTGSQKIKKNLLSDQKDFAAWDPAMPASSRWDLRGGFALPGCWLRVQTQRTLTAFLTRRLWAPTSPRGTCCLQTPVPEEALTDVLQRPSLSPGRGAGAEGQLHVGAGCVRDPGAAGAARRARCLPASHPASLSLRAQSRAGRRLLFPIRVFEAELFS